MKELFRLPAYILVTSVPFSLLAAAVALVVEPDALWGGVIGVSCGAVAVVVGNLLYLRRRT